MNSPLRDLIAAREPGADAGAYDEQLRAWSRDRRATREEKNQ